MDQFRVRKHQPSSVDGFIPRTGKLEARKKSKTSIEDTENTPIDKIDRSQDGLTPNASPLPVDQFQNRQPLDDQPAEEKLSRKQRKALKKERRTKRSRVWRYTWRTALAMVVLALSVGGYIGAKAYLAQKHILKGGASGAVALRKEVKPEELLNGEGDGRVNILLLGKGGGDHPGADLTDSMMLASIDPISKEAALLSIPRDLWVNSPGYWSMKINAVYASAKERALSKNSKDTAAAEAAGVAALKSVIQTDIGVPIHYYVMIDFTAFKQAVDAVGGVDVDVKEPLYDYVQAWDNNNNPLIASAGMQHFDGKKALLYTRSRSSSSDFARGQRQRDVIVALKQKVLTAGTFSNPVTISKLLDSLGDNVTSDLKLSEVMRIYDIAKNIPETKILSLGFTDPPNVLVKTDNINGQSVVEPRAGVTDFSEIQSFVRNNLRDGFLKSENASVVILNGTSTPGLATAKSAELKSYGYNVISVDDAPTKDYTTTKLIDFTNGVKKYTKHYLEQRLKTTAVTSSPGISQTVYNADFVIIVGSNEAKSSTN